MDTVPEELREQAIKEMQARFGFEDGVAENFDETMIMAVDIQKKFLANLPDPSLPTPNPLDNMRQLSPKRRSALIANMTRAANNIKGAGASNNQFLIDQHRLRLGTFFMMDRRLSSKTADALAGWIVENVKP